jgi:hypothetical protein
MDFVAFPFRVGAKGRLVRSSGPEESVSRLLTIMGNTSTRGWSASTKFGLRETLLAMRSNRDRHLAAIRELNELLQELGILWMRIDNIEPVASKESNEMSYELKFSYGDGTGATHLVKL